MPNLAKIKIGDFILDPSRNVLIGADGDVALEPKVVDVLVVLAAQPGTVLSRDKLIDIVWKTEFGADERLTRAISQLRKAFRDERGAARYIETVSKRGYRLVAAVGPVTETNRSIVGTAETTPPMTTAAEAVRSPLPALPSRPWHAYAGAGVLVVLAVAGLMAVTWRDTAPSVATDVVALMPLLLIDAREGMDTFALQTHASVKRIMATNQVAVVEGAASRSSPQATGVSEFVLSGTLERSGDDYAATLYLDNRADNQTLWSRRFVRRIADAENLREEIGGAVAYLIGCGVKQRAAARVRPTIAAFKIYLEVCDPSRRSDESDILASAQRLIAVAPDDAYGHALAAVANALIATSPSELSKAQIEAHESGARKAAHRSLELDPGSPYAHFALALIAPAAEHWMALEAFVQRVGADHPAIRDIGIYTASLRSSGRLKEALHLAEQRAVRSPLSIRAKVAIAVLNVQMGNHEKADRLLGEALHVSPDDSAAHWYRFVNAAFYGDAATAMALLSETSPAPNMDRGVRECMRKFIDVRRLGSQPSGRAALRTACDGHVGRGYPVRMMAALGDVDAAFAAALGESIDAGGETTFLFYPEMAAFRRDPRFMPLIAKSGLLEFWTTSGHWPDFCTDGAAPYDCKTAAARALQDKVASGQSSAPPR